MQDRGMAQERHKLAVKITGQKQPKLAGKKLQTEKKALSRREQRMLDSDLLSEARRGSLRKVKSLLKAGANIEGRGYLGNYGWTPLMHAALNPDISICALLIEKGAKINARNKRGTTALTLAARHGLTETCAFLIEKGADVKAKDDIGMTALFFAAQGDSSQTCALLLEKGADVNARDKSGKTALQLARSNHKKETTAFLTLMTFAPSIFADREAANLFYSDFRACVGK
jgi:ankyrin repeat protein